MKEAIRIINTVPNRTADESMEELRNNSHVFKGLRIKEGRKRVHSINSNDSINSDISDSTMNGMEDFKFTYEEEADPETFFIPYTWSVIVSTVTSGLLEWDKKNIKVFPIMQYDFNDSDSTAGEGFPINDTNDFVQDVDNVV